MVQAFSIRFTIQPLVSRKVRTGTTIMERFTDISLELTLSNGTHVELELDQDKHLFISKVNHDRTVDHWEHLDLPKDMNETQLASFKANVLDDLSWIAQVVQARLH